VSLIGENLLAATGTSVSTARAKDNQPLLPAGEHCHGGHDRKKRTGNSGGNERQLGNGLAATNHEEGSRLWFHAACQPTI
jgi:hypothetical protein